MYEIINDNGVIHSGSEEEMTHAFDVMKSPVDYDDEENDKWWTDWSGDLKLVRVIQRTR
jgi:hypothetical protein